jgi:hypothetical protein
VTDQTPPPEGEGVAAAAPASKTIDRSAGFDTGLMFYLLIPDMDKKSKRDTQKK